MGGWGVGPGRTLASAWAVEDPHCGGAPRAMGLPGLFLCPPSKVPEPLGFPHQRFQPPQPPRDTI